MSIAPLELLQITELRFALKQAWEESSPGTIDAREQGGFLCQSTEGMWSVDRWPYGEQREIIVPPHPDGRRNGEVIVATFHTHPNIGSGFRQEPSPRDIRSVRDDPDLKGTEYIGEFVVSADTIYLITPSGNVISLCSTQKALEVNRND